jgi:FkbM family methyltransferase
MSDAIDDFLGFECPPDLRADAALVLGGEYELPGATFGSPPRVVDVGANVGAFLRWAERRWPDATIDGYEPHPRTFAYLRRNAEVCTNARVHNVAVGDATRDITLHEGVHNACEASTCEDIAARLGSSAKLVVPCIDAGDLPECEVLKIDTEGSELPILRRFLERHDLPPALVMLEFHRKEDRRALEDLLGAYGLELVRARIDTPFLGVCWFLHPLGVRRHRRARSSPT